MQRPVNSSKHIQKFLLALCEETLLRNIFEMSRVTTMTEMCDKWSFISSDGMLTRKEEGIITTKILQICSISNCKDINVYLQCLLSFLILPSIVALLMVKIKHMAKQKKKIETVLHNQTFSKLNNDFLQPIKICCY